MARTSPPAREKAAVRCRESPDYVIIVCTTPMPSTARCNTVRAAAQVLGGAAALAERLGVSLLQVERWASGEESVPTEIFLHAVDLLEQHDRRRQPRPPGNDTQPGQG